MLAAIVCKRSGILQAARALCGVQYLHVSYLAVYAQACAMCFRTYRILSTWYVI